VLCAVVIGLAMANAARAWHGGGEWHHHNHWRYHNRFGDHWYLRPVFLVPPVPHFVVPAPFGVRVYQGYDPGYYPVPVYRAPCREDYDDQGEDEDREGYYPAPPSYVPVPPVSVNFGFTWGR
jgi:hypothetical protein